MSALTASPAEESILILGGGGMVGLQVAREAARELQPARIIISALTEPEVDAAIAILSQETKGIELIGVSGDIFIPESLQGKDRDEQDRRNHADDHPRLPQLVHGRLLWQVDLAQETAARPAMPREFVIRRVIQREQPS